jgi:hypothetical protein
MQALQRLAQTATGRNRPGRRSCSIVARSRRAHCRSGASALASGRTPVDSQAATSTGQEGDESGGNGAPTVTDCHPRPDHHESGRALSGPLAVRSLVELFQSPVAGLIEIRKKER